MEVGAAFDLPYRLLDYAGQPEYWVSHQYFLSASNSVYVIVVSLVPPNEAAKSFNQQLLYWIAYLASQRRPKAQLTRIVVIGTYRDVVSDVVVTEFENLVQQIAQHLLPELGFVAPLTRVCVFFLTVRRLVICRIQRTLSV